jgi:hypothetical protein
VVVGRDAWVVPAPCAALLVAVALTFLVGCEGSSPTGADGSGREPGSVTLLEGSTRFRTLAVSWTERDPLTGRVPDHRFAFIAFDSQRLSGRTHAFYEAPVKSRCDDAECFPATGDGWSEPDLIIEDLDWSPAGAQVVFQARERNDSAVRLDLKAARGGERDEVVSGRMPSFSRDGSKVVYVTQGRDGLSWFNSTGTGGGDWLQGYAGVEYPRFSPGDSLVAFSSTQGGNGRRIHVWDTRHPEYFADVVTDPDSSPSGATQDGTDDNYPTWSPGGRYIAYKTTLRTGTFRDAIFVTVPGAEPEPNRELLSFGPGQELRFLRWHPDGELLLFILDGDVYLYVLPEQYRDRPAP